MIETLATRRCRALLQAAAKDIEFLGVGRRLEVGRGQARIALPSDRSFRSFDQALAAVRSQRLPPSTDVYWNQDYFDAVLEYPLNIGATVFAIDFLDGFIARREPGLLHVQQDGQSSY